VIQYSSRPFSNVAEMNDALMKNYRNAVGSKDTVLWLGDCFLCPPELARNILTQLPGRKILCLGNHDRSAAAMARMGFDLVTDAVTLNIAGRTVRANHYPYVGTSSREVDTERSELPWPTRRQEEALLHGHTHSQKRRDGNMIHVGVDAWDYRPASSPEIEELVRSVFGA